MTFGWMSKHGIDDAMIDEWLRPILSQRAIRRDLTKYIRAVDKRALLDVAQRLPSFDKPVLVAWAAEDKLMPLEHGRRFADLFPNARLVEVSDSRTLIPLDQPEVLAGLIADHVRGGEGATVGADGRLTTA
jgi:pimeloyl-ACP methyl ester carboxylesterase